MTVSLLAPFRDTIHAISSFLFIPAIVVLLLFVAVAVVESGSLLAEALTERRRVRITCRICWIAFKIKTPGRS